MKKLSQFLFICLIVLASFAVSSKQTYAIQQQNIMGSVVGTMNTWLLPICDPEGGVLGNYDLAPQQRNSIYESLCTNDPIEQNITTTLGGKSDNNAPTKSLYYANFQFIAAAIDHPPVESSVYVADVLRQVSPTVDTAYAQGIGFAALNPVLTLWKAARNIAYFFFVIAFMIVGFAIMFRAKLNPQTVVNIQLALPQLVITLLLITFSYAIAGLVIDLMYIVIYILVGVVGVVAFGGKTTELADIAFNDSILTNVFQRIVTGEALGAVNSAMQGTLLSVLDIDLEEARSVGDIPTQFVALIGPGAIGLVFTFIFAILMLWNGFKIFFALLNAYVQIILLVITAPLRLLLNVYPGSQAFMTWLKELVGHAAVFPVVIGMLFIAFMLLGIQNSTVTADNVSSGFSAPQLNFGSPQAAAGIVAIGLLLTIPQMIEQTKSFFGVSGGGGGGGGGGAFGGGAAGGAIGGIFGSMMAPGRMAAGMGMNLYKGAAMSTLGKAFTGEYGAKYGDGIGGMIRALPDALNPARQVQMQKALGEQRDQQLAEEKAIRNAQLNKMRSQNFMTEEEDPRNLPSSEGATPRNTSSGTTSAAASGQSGTATDDGSSANTF